MSPLELYGKETVSGRYMVKGMGMQDTRKSKEFPEKRNSLRARAQESIRKKQLN